MPKETQKSTSSTKATYGQIHPESNQYIDKFAAFEPANDPTIGFRAGAAKRQLANSFINPLGGFSTPQRDEAIRRAGYRDIDQQAGMESRMGAFDRNRLRMGQLGSLASLMSPKLVQTGTEGKSESQAGQNIWGTLLQIAQSAARGAMMGA